ncbi:MAG: helix-turn-helix domain-containing protein [Candidatus Methylacidiphilales bacterium]
MSAVETTDNDNITFNLASDLVKNTNISMFLTGKAGTGKTTFLKHIQNSCNKRMVIVAPTGVAAINAGGVTMHSFFQLPFLPFIKEANHGFGQVECVNRYTHFKNVKFNREKIDLLNELDLLIIDEVSMLRVDMVDCIDETLKYYRRNQLPFGGVQVLFIGDMFQLPPVTSDNEWTLLSQYYKSPFFFSSEVYQQLNPAHLELNKIYRQKEERFINLLNNIRHNNMDDYDFELLQERYDPEAARYVDGLITLTTHNRTADNINQQKLAEIESEPIVFEGEINGDFNEKSLPAEKSLQLKNGAQIMFIKNDIEKRYFNGKLAKIKSIAKDEIIVEFESGSELKIERETWRNIRYNLNRDENQIEEEEIGSFKQFPIRLAWAITIHKSQGLTLDRLAIDAGASFAAGQVYVALSRCRTFDGLTLLSRIYQNSILSDDRIVQFSLKQSSEQALMDGLDSAKFEYGLSQLYKTFDLRKVVQEYTVFEAFTATKQIPDKEETMQHLNAIIRNLNEHRIVADKFKIRVEEIIKQNPIDANLLSERVKSAKTYFAKKILDDAFKPLQSIETNLKPKQKTKQFITNLQKVKSFTWKRIHDIETATLGSFDISIEAIDKPNDIAETINQKVVKVNSKEESLKLYNEGKTIEEIAAFRGMAVSTIGGHLAHYVDLGELNALDFVSVETIEMVKKLLADGKERFGELKADLPPEVTFDQIRMAVAYLKNTKT